MLESFNNVSDLFEASEKVGNVHGTTKRLFTGHTSLSEAQAMILNGDTANIENIRSLVDSFTDSSIDSEQTISELGVAGAFPLVPVHLAGSPCSMVYDEISLTDNAPLRVFASCCVSGGLDTSDLEKRGSAILAAVLQLQKTRSVELYIIGELQGSEKSGGSCIVSVKIDCLPIDLAVCGYMLSHPAFLRHVLFNIADPYGFDGAWAYGSNPTDSSFQEKVKTELGADEDDLYICGGYLGDPIINKPVEWVSEQIERHSRA